MKITDNRYREYFFALRRVNTLHRSFGFGRSPDIPSGFSESLARHLLNLNVGTDRTHDAIDRDGRRCEIKATGSPEGKTTISNNNEFEDLIWLYFDFERCSLHVHRIPRALFQLSGKGGRSSISLSAVARSNGITADVFTFDIMDQDPLVDESRAHE